MGRNPVVGRQGPEYYMAVIPTEAEAPRIRVKQIRSGIGQPVKARRTLRALGLGDSNGDGLLDALISIDDRDGGRSSI